MFAGLAEKRHSQISPFLVSEASENAKMEFTRMAFSPCHERVPQEKNSW